MQLAFRHLRILWRAERVIAETRLRILLRRSMLYALAGLIAVFGLAMLNVAAFYALQPHWGPVWAALIAALGDFVIAVVIFSLAQASKPGLETTAAVELRDASVEGLEAELAPLQTWFTRAARDPFDTVLPAIVVPLITTIIRSLRKSRQGDS